jgi:hypothetical protein
MVTDCTDVYVPAATERLGVATVPVAIANTAADALFFAESVAVSAALLVPTTVGVKVRVVAKDPPVSVEVQVPVVAAEKAAAEVPVAANVTVGAGLQLPSFSKVVIFVAVDGVPLGLVVPTRLSTAIL